jgi:hypothetical protein
MRRILLVTVITTLGCGRQAQVSTPAAPRGITSADQLLSAMHDRYAGKWYRNITFIQKSTFLRPDGTTSRVETWYEAGAIPGRLRIDLGAPSKGNGALYRNDSVYSIGENRIVQRQRGRNPLMVLGFDVYGQSPERTFEQLKGERIDMTILRTDTLYGKRVYVVGALPNDYVSNQFWVEADRLLFVRLIQTNPERTRTQDVRFRKYVAHAGGWVAEEVRVLVGGRMVFHEEYSKVRVNVPLDADLFIPEKWATAKHWYTP